jgi:cytoskeleton protein RodZ
MMEQNNTPETALPSDQNAITGLSVGQRLREARERQGLSVDDVVAKIKLAPRQIVALEADDFKSLPETAFVRGFVRSYAKLLQIDAQSLLEALPGAKVVPVQVDPLHVESPFPSEKTARRQNLNLLIAALLIAIGLAGFAVWQANSSPSAIVQKPLNTLSETPLPMPDRVEMLDASGVAADVPAASAVQMEQMEQMPVASAVASAVTPAPAIATSSVAAVQPVAPAASSTLRLVFDKDAWVEIKDKFGKSLTNHLNSGGSELSVEGVAPFSLVVGHATSVHLYYRNKPVDMTPYVNASSEVARLTLE